MDFEELTLVSFDTISLHPFDVVSNDLPSFSYFKVALETLTKKLLLVLYPFFTKNLVKTNFFFRFVEEQKSTRPLASTALYEPPTTT